MDTDNDGSQVAVINLGVQKWMPVHDEPDALQPAGETILVRRPEDALRGETPVRSGFFRTGAGEEFFFEYTYTEIVYVVEGVERAVLEDGSELTFRAGDMFFVAKGTRLTWQYVTPVLEVYMIYDADSY